MQNKTHGAAVGFWKFNSSVRDDPGAYFNVFMYVSGSFWNIPTQSGQQNPIFFPWYIRKTLGSTSSLVFTAQYLLIGASAMG
jgi:hypothetical protein